MDSIKKPFAILALACVCLFAACKRASPPSPQAAEPVTKSFQVTGVVTQLQPPDSLTVRHEAVPNYMPAMTMPFKLKRTNELAEIQPGQKVTFRLFVTGEESWIEDLRVLGQASVALSTNTVSSVAAPKQDSSGEDDYTFTNELGRRVNLADFNGQALGITFIFTRCPVPDYCPRLSKNFQEASQKLLSRPNTPTNWHLLSVSIDPEFDVPGILKSYAERHHYDSNHWSFLTGPKDRILKLESMFGFEAKPEAGAINHSFRTIIINTSNQVQQIYPFSGDFSDSIMKEMLKAMGVTNSVPP